MKHRGYMQHLRLQLHQGQLTARAGKFFRLLVDRLSSSQLLSPILAS